MSLLELRDGHWGIAGPWGFRAFPKCPKGRVLGLVAMELGFETDTPSQKVLEALCYKKWDFESQRWVDDFSGRLRLLREQAGLSQNDLARRAGLSNQGVAALEQGSRQPAFDTVRKLAHALGISVHQFTFISDTEIDRLPRWARAAFAARCARRVLGLLLQTWPNAPAQFQQALHLVDESVTKGRISKDLKEISDDVKNFARAALGMTQIRISGSPAPRVPASDIIRHGSAGAIASAVQTVITGSTQDAFQAYRHADNAALEARAAGVDIAALQDFERLLFASINERWKDETAVSPETLGSL